MQQDLGDKVLAIQANAPVGITAHYFSLRQLKKYDGVIAMGKQFLADFPDIWSVAEKPYLGSGYSRAWRKAAEVDAKHYGRSRSDMTTVDGYLLGGDKQSVIRWMEKAYEEHDYNLPYIACSPQWDALRSEPGIQPLLRLMNLPQ